MMSTLTRNVVMVCSLAVLCAALIGCSSSGDDNSADLQRQLDMEKAARMMTEDQLADLQEQVEMLMGRADISPEDLASLRTQIEMLMGRADVSPEDLASLRTQIEMLMGRADVSPEDLAEIEEELEEFRMAQMLREQEEMLQQQQEQARLDTMAAAGLEGGLARSPQPAVYATSEQDTVASLLPGGQTVFSPSSAALYWDWFGADETVAQPDLGAAYVKSFSSDGAGGFHVTYVIDGTEYPVHFTKDLYSSAPADQHYRKLLEDNEVYLWSWTGSFSPDDDDHTDGASFRSYHDVHGWSFVGGGGEFRGASTSGLRTMPANLPTGSATFEGYMIGEWWDADEPEYRGVDGNTFIEADLNLEANLDDGTISGRMDEFRIPSWHSASGENEPLAGSSVDIASTMIDEARFAADWVGNGPMDVSPGETLHGFTGRIIGEFYGPAAEEAGGVLSGQRAAMGGAGEQFITGGFSTSQSAPDQ